MHHFDTQAGSTPGAGGRDKIGVMDTAQRWGLPPGFAPVRFPITDEVKEVVRRILEPDEAVIATIANESGTVSIVATNQSLITVKSGDMGATATGVQTKEYLWEAIENLVLQPGSLNVAIQIHYKTSGGGKVEIGRRAKMGRDAVDKVMPFHTENGTAVFEALHTVWEHKRTTMNNE
jgi:hypothetical protein